MMKKFSTIVLFLLLLTVTVFAAVSCGDPESGSGEMTLEIKDMPQLMYVVGEELDLSNGILTVKENGESREMPMNGEGITVSGFDKTKTGEQKVTLSYNGKSVEITVTVVERMQAIECISEYLVGDELDTSKGRLKITRDDGSSYTVILNHEKVTLEGFDSEKAGTCHVKASYEADGETYTCTFAVQVYAVESVELQRPNKIAYDSHEGGLDLSGGYLTLRANGGKLEKDIPLTADSVKVEGFDLSAVNESNTPYTQKITVLYGDEEYSYDIRLTYTDISAFKKNSAKFAEIDWEGDEWPEISAELGQEALELMELYLDMAPSDTQYITKDESLCVARAAFWYGMEQIEAEIVSLEDAFTFMEGEFQLTCKTPEALEVAIEALAEDDNVLFTLTPTVTAISKAFAKEEIAPGYLFGEYALPEAEVYEGLSEIFEFMLDLHDRFEELPANWKELNLSDYQTQIEGIYDFIFNSDYAEGAWGEIYYYVSSWRAADDAFDILYVYYYGLDDIDTMQSLATVCLPGSLQEIASYLVMAMEQIDAIASFASIDTSNFFFNYYMAVRTAEAIRTGEDEMTRTLYEVLPINTMMGWDDSTLFYFDDLLEYVRTIEGGYYHYSGALLDLPCYHELMDQYMDILMRILNEDDYKGSAEYNADIEEMFAMYVALTPTRQLNFLATLNPYYAMNIPPLAFDAVFSMEGMGETDMSTLFVDLLRQYYRGLFENEEAQVAYNELVIAMELYAQRFSSDTWLEDFRARLDKVQQAYDAMSDADQEVFDQKLGFAYNKYLAISARCDEEPVMPEGVWEEKFRELDEAIQLIEFAYTIISQPEYQIPMYNMLLSACERALKIEAEILACGDPDILDIYYYEPLHVKLLPDELPEGGEDNTEGGTDAEATPMTYTYEYMMGVYRGVYVSTLLTMMDVGIYDSYVASDLKAFEEMTYDVMWRYAMSDPESTEKVFDRETVLAVMESFVKLSLDEQTMFILMESDYGYYYEALAFFLEEAFTEKASNVAIRMLTLEQKCLVYAVLMDDASLEDVRNTLDEMKELYRQLDEAGAEEDKASFADLEELYATYVAKAEQLIADAEAEAEDEAAA